MPVRSILAAPIVAAALLLGVACSGVQQQAEPEPKLPSGPVAPASSERPAEPIRVPPPPLRYAAPAATSAGDRIG